MEPFIGQIMMVSFDYAPAGWALCNGQLLSIAQNQTLYSLLGTTYGGDGRTTFALPDLRGRCAIGVGQGSGLQDYVQGQAGGTETVTLTQSQMPQHNHALAANNGNGTVSSPTGALPAKAQVTPEGENTVDGNTYIQGIPNTIMSPQTIQPNGGGQPHNNMQPYLAMNYIIALVGIFPSRN